MTVAEIGLGSDVIGDTNAPDPLAAASDLGRLIVHNRRDFLSLAFSAGAVLFPLNYDPQAAAAALRATATGHRVGIDEVATVRQFTEMFRTADERLGGGHGLVAIASFLNDVVTPMLNGTFPNDQVRRSAFGAGAELATLVGWKCHDLGREGAAQRFYQLAYQFACESDPAGHSAWAMRALTHQALDIGHPAGTIDVAEAALARARGRVCPQTEALLLITAARAHGASGNGPTAAALILAAEDAMLASNDDIPAYAAAAGPAAAVVASHTGRTLTEMKDHAAAERHYRTALNKRVPGTYHRVRGITFANIAKSVAAQHRHEEAVGLWSQSLDLMDGVISRRNGKELETMRSNLALYAQRGIPGAAELSQRAASITAV
ncbi:tetratricopeptide repeat protein [Kitasatospora sp. NPDC059088]|uniref:tetratricopeptide repeat protein n=1 Tax=Kitasatospora sp. NPDC059088 TaxID=3346722 RepID=UPI0036992D9F